VVRVLITGDEGFIGRHFRAVCEHRGWDVTGCDIKSGADCRTLFATDETRYDLVIHCAAMVGGRAMIDGDPLAIAQNLAIDSDLFRWAIRTRPGRVVYFSSSAAYPVELQHRPSEFAVRTGTARRLAEIDLNLSNPGLPDQTYGWAKLTGEVLAACAKAEGVPVSVFRPFSGYGADQDLTYPFPAFIARAVAHTDPFVVWGDGTQARDFIHVDDVVAAVFAAVFQQYDEPLNLCTGRATSFLELAAIVAKAARYTPGVDTIPDAPTGVHHRVGDPARMNRIYRPRVTLEEGVARAVAPYL
jgi:nucleoside-diphosphate-sugar epimerase